MNFRNEHGHRVVITGLGTVNPISLTADEYWKELLAGTSGAGPITQFDASDLPVKIAAEVKDFDPKNYMDPKAARRMARFAQFSVAASSMAIADADLTITPENAYDVGVMVATGGGGVGEVMDETEVLLTKGPDRVNPLFVPAMIANMASCQVSINFGIKGPVTTNIAACAAGIYAYFEAIHFLRRGDIQAAVAGGTESAILPLSFISLGRIGALSKNNDDALHASRPFDRDRDGFVFGEGAGVMVLETLEHAIGRGARIYAELAGAATNSDAFHLTAPEPTGESASRAMTAALRDAGVAPSDVDYICAHGTGTPLNDASETRAIKRVFGEAAYKVSISSPKSMIGHLLGAAGGMSAITATKAIYHGIVPPTSNLENADPECDLDYTPLVPKERTIEVAMANGFGFGGQNAVIVLKSFSE
jgi:3-oxoacyl-[acyl-carrier-protein] synthase II